MGSLETMALATTKASGKKSAKQKAKEAKLREGGHYSKTGAPGASEQYTGIKPGQAPGAAPLPGNRPGQRLNKRLGGARTPMAP
jgi:hypothetical protein